ncbi:MAG: nicotinamide-nucleotide amidohydrolase family protein [Candidatus Atribacteria bacterium]|nr:nicotinamide-nucleotide amidohydrolase family protein [Candidatus Atribacteria bacterium]
MKFCGIGESQFEMNIKPLLTELPPSLKPAYLPSFGEVWFYLYSDQKNLDTVERAERVIQKIKDQYHQYLFTPFGDTLEEACGQLLCRFHLTLSTAESCTGGLLIHRLTNISGSSQYVNRGYVVYSNKAKENDLAIPELIIQEKGAVSEEVARLLAEHVREKTGTDFGIGITGIAGPTGGLETKPVGLVYIALAEEKQTLVRKHIFSGDRIVNKTFASQFALTYLFQALRKKYECLP